MDKLFEIMASDLGITPYQGEAEESFVYRITYSALGLWCLTYARSSTQENEGISKNAQSILLHNLIDEYVRLCPSNRQFLKEAKLDAAVFIRNLYEQTGFLLSSEKNYNVLNRGAETIRVSAKDYLYFGIPSERFIMNGLGIHCNNSGNEVSLRDFLIRDSLKPNEFINANYNPCDFEEKDFDFSELEFFDTLSPKPLSQSWQKRITSEYTIARKSVSGPYYRVLQVKKGEVMYSNAISNTDSVDAMTGEEFRRLYIALRHYYSKPMVVYCNPIDHEYTHVKILGQMPNREYFYLLLNGWPQKFVADRYNFIMRNEMVAQSVGILEHLGFDVKNGGFYG